MRIKLLAVGTKMPGWVNQGCEEYHKRLPAELAPELLEVPLAHRGKSADIARAVEKEGAQMLAAIASNDLVIALDVKGSCWSTEQLAARVDQWRMDGRNVVLLVGGPDGLAPACLQRADQKWSLSALTLPHPMVRIILAEQLYRAWSILSNHPYHRH
jgi:23S rRNA (pseudouridine1915-N3)-methyltransferase